MEKSSSSEYTRKCCCMNQVCYRMGSTLDVSGCYDRGGKVVKRCSDCK
jgi:hypothetical protein